MKDSETQDKVKPSVVDFLKRLRDALKGHVDIEDFNSAVRLARSHAGGIAKARKQQDQKAKSDEQSAPVDQASLAKSGGVEISLKTSSEFAELSKSSVNYRSGTSDERCGNCRMFQSDTSSCSLVIGSISPSMLCDRWAGSTAASESPDDLDDLESMFAGHMMSPSVLPMMKLEKSDDRVNYREAEGVPGSNGEAGQCGECRFYSPGCCQLVEGTIEADCSCDLYTEPPDLGSSHPTDPAYGFAEGHHANFEPDLKLFFELQEFAEPPEWIPFLPTPGKYQHPRFGTVEMSPTRAKRMMKNFADKVYQGHIPIDLEHSLKTSGAAGYVQEFRQNGDGSVDAKIDWTDLGRDAIKKDRFRYFSPEWWDKWNHPTTGQSYNDVIVGGALTTRPFFKDSKFGGLRPLVASEKSVLVWDDGNWQTFSEEPWSFYTRGKNPASHRHSGSSSGSTVGVSHESEAAAVEAASHLHKGDTVVHRTGQSGAIIRVSRPLRNTRHETDPGKYHNMVNVEHDDKSVSTWRDSHLVSHIPKSSGQSKTRKASEGADQMGMTEDETKRFDELFDTVGQLNVRVEATEKERDSALEQLKAANEQMDRLVATDQIRRYTELSSKWPGEMATNIATLQTLARAYGEESEEFKGFTKTMSDAAEQLQKSQLFHEVGTSRRESAVPSSRVFGEIDEKAHKLMSETPGLSIEAARVQVFNNDPELYDKYESERVKKVRSLTNG